MLRWWEVLGNKISIRHLNLDLVTEKLTQFRQNQLTCAWLQGQRGPEEEVKGWTSFKEIFLGSVCRMIVCLSEEHANGW